MHGKTCRKILCLLLSGIVLAMWTPSRLMALDQVSPDRGNELRGTKIQERDASTKALDFSITTTKKKYYEGELIYLTGSLRNISRKTQYVNERFVVQDSDITKVNWGIVLHIYTESGKKIEFGIRREMPRPSADWFVAVVPNKSLSREFSDDISLFVKRSGKYRIAAFYVNHLRPDATGVNAWQGVIESNTVTIEVVEK